MFVVTNHQWLVATNIKTDYPKCAVVTVFFITMIILLVCRCAIETDIIHVYQQWLSGQYQHMPTHIDLSWVIEKSSHSISLQSITINHQPWSTMINHDQPWPTMINHDQPWSAINHLPSTIPWHHLFSTKFSIDWMTHHYYQCVSFSFDRKC